MLAFVDGILVVICHILMVELYRNLSRSVLQIHFPTSC